jgi:hypothetical protein
MTTLLAKRNCNASVATNDVAYEMLVADPEMPQFQSSSYDSTHRAAQPQLNLTTAGDNAAQNAEVLVDNDNKDWVNKRWRPMLGWVYIAACITDFMLFPVLWSILQAISNGSVVSQWQPVTLQGAGLFHISMGACIGITAYGRTKEKIAGKD